MFHDFPIKHGDCPSFLYEKTSQSIQRCASNWALGTWKTKVTGKDSNLVISSRAWACWKVRRPTMDSMDDLDGKMYRKQSAWWLTS